MLLFPFINSNGGDIVECVLLPEMPIWASNRAEEGALVNRHLLVVMLLLCGSRFFPDVESLKVEYPSDGTKKALIKERIQTVQENMIDLLKKAERKVEESDTKLKESDTKLKESERENKELKREITKLKELMASTPSAKV